MRTLRVLIVTTWWPTDDQPNVAPFNVAHAKAIARHHDVRVVRIQRVVEPRTNVRDPRSGLPLTTVSANPRDPVATARSLNELRKMAKDADVIHTMAYDGVTVLAPLAPLISKRWVHTEHWSMFVKDGASGVPFRVKHTMRLPRKITAVTQDLADAIAPYARPGALSVVPCILNDSFAATPQPSWEPLKLVAVSSLIPRKRPLLAVDTVRELIDGGMNVHLTWVGDGPLREDTLRRAEELGVEANVALTGFVQPDQVAEHVRNANMFFLPTEVENFLTSAAESLACGRPVVVPNTGGFTEYITANNGVIAEDETAQGFAKAVREAAARLKDESPESIRATVIPKFSFDTVGDQFDAIYRSLAS
ncbi:MAG TPA: glycosyltransferase [Pseudonocardiaceae bacterium]|jgi:glycosyltransferase involved in cell wall biosynthesis|nr:glycosyltransferase [Pseudonocardiaceae bacterium]